MNNDMTYFEDYLAEDEPELVSQVITLMTGESLDQPSVIVLGSSSGDAIKLIGDDIRCEGVVVADQSGSQDAHRDAFQLIPSDPSMYANSQYMGAISSNISLVDCMVDAKGSKLQGIFASDGIFKDILIDNCSVVTSSVHEISLSGVISGVITNNDAKVVLEPARFGGGLQDAFYVTSFINNDYEEIVASDNNSFEDNRRNPSRKHIKCVDNFDLELWYSIAQCTKFTNIRQHFKAVSDIYFAGTGVVSGETLADVISSNEGDWLSYNKGRAGDTRAKLPDVSVLEVLERGELRRGDPNRIWAVGKYQVIPSTLKMAVNSGVVQLSDMIRNKDTQNNILYYILTKKRKRVKAFITTGIGVNPALHELAKEWASLPVPSTGQSYYAGNGSDKAHTSLDDVKTALNRSRHIYLSQENGTFDEFSRIYNSIF